MRGYPRAPSSRPALLVLVKEAEDVALQAPAAAEMGKTASLIPSVRKGIKYQAGFWPHKKREQMLNQAK